MELITFFKIKFTNFMTGEICQFTYHKTYDRKKLKTKIINYIFQLNLFQINLHFLNKNLKQCGQIF